ncbi:MAG TPA: 16S rRNA (cytidine(1402)-2'-O)-methyltransferase [Vicinamibacterales bacterium]|nr:16S rRNA (cytidine(1402)-2'-O)-methyltransferase [Vicinamibacterales bacterium]
MSGTLFVVATPIGNLEDVTLRALRVLREVELIAAEDTRRTARLLSHHGISTPMLSFHQHNWRERVSQLVARLAAGKSVAVVTDAGTPGVSDPGAELVQACVEAGIPVDPIPGASAPLTAAIASGFPLVPLTVFGFAPSRSKARTNWLTAICKVTHTFTFFETPHRIAATMAGAAVLLGERPIVVGRELTKVHQEFLRGTAKELIGRFEQAKGEFTVVVGPLSEDGREPELVADSTIAHDFWHSTEYGGLSRRAAIAAIAKKYRRPAREVYAIVENAKLSVE